MYLYTLGIDAPGRGYREAKVVEQNEKQLREVCNLLLEHNTKVTIKDFEAVFTLTQSCNCEICGTKATYQYRQGRYCTKCLCK